MVKPTADERFWAKVLKTDACWLWQGGLTYMEGYGRFWDGSKKVRAHRWSYERFCGPIPEGMTLDHLCRNRACVNPAHLEVVTNKENVLRGEGHAARNARKTHCIRGHPLNGDNLVMRQGKRACRICRNARQRTRYAEAIRKRSDVPSHIASLSLPSFSSRDLIPARLQFMAWAWFA